MKTITRTAGIVAAALASVAIITPTASAQSLDLGSLKGLGNIGNVNTGGQGNVSQPATNPDNQIPLPQSAQDAIEQDLRVKVNQARRNNGKGVIGWDSAVARSSRAWSQHLANTNAFYHSTLQAGYGECLYRSGAPVNQFGPQLAVDAWLKSPGHRDILLRDRTSAFGVGAAQNSNGTWTITMQTKIY